ncbi:MAG: PAS domain S-box protein [Desulfopila sp.]|jgi:PAS domain S-box-containing protein|nr:PAS domain S-box protein [Desulfopila sp.]
MKELLNHILQEMETFLAHWTAYMEEAGYLEHTTAKKEDCILSLRGLLEPVLALLDKETSALRFAKILEHNRELASFLVQTSRRHQARGIQAEMFFGCFKTLLHAVEDIVLSDFDDAEKYRNYIEFRKVVDAIETITIAAWDSSMHDVKFDILAAKNRSLTLEKNKYENIFEATSDLVLVINDAGVILELNGAAREYFGNECLGDMILRYIEHPEYDLEMFLEKYPHSLNHEIQLEKGKASYSMVIVPLKKVSLASAGYIIILSDITSIVDHRTQLEQLILERTEALRQSEQLFRSLFTSAGEGILLVDTSLNIVQANEKASTMFDMSSSGLEGMSCYKIIHPDSIDSFLQSASIREGDVWHGEVNCISGGDGAFPASITVNKFLLGGEVFLHIIVCNISGQKAMERHLREEKTKAEEMNVTLKNVMKAIDRDKEEFELSISQRITTSIIPSLLKLAAEENSEIRDMYMKVLRDQLAGLTRSSSSMNNEDIIRLTKSEVQICQMIQSGSASKDIADAMSISLETVQTHRKNIRKKLGLSGKDINLYSYLNK